MNLFIFIHQRNLPSTILTNFNLSNIFTNVASKSNLIILAAVKKKYLLIITMLNLKEFFEWKGFS